jgi:small subunit ribosomal protein S10
MKSIIQLSFKSVDKKSLNFFKDFVKSIFKKLGVVYTIASMPIVKKRITLLKSPHVNKSAREQFEIRYYKYTLTLKFNFNENYLRFLVLNKPKTVAISLKKL